MKKESETGHKFPSPIQLLESDVQSLAAIQGDINLSLACLLIEKGSYSIAVNYLRSTSPETVIAANGKIWFCLKAQLLCALGDYAQCKDMLLQRIEESPEDDLLLSVLQYAIWEELQSVSAGHSTASPRPAPEPAGSGEKRSISSQEFSGYFTKCRPEHTEALVLWQVDREVSNVIKWQKHKQSFEKLPELFTSMLPAVLGLPNLNTVESCCIHFEKYNVHSFHMNSAHLAVIHLRTPDAVPDRHHLEHTFRKSGPCNFRVSGDAGNKPDFKISSLYEASLLDSRDLDECLSYLSLDESVFGAGLYDLEGRIMALGHGSSEDFVWQGPFFIAEYLRLTDALGRTRFGPADFQATRGRKSFYFVRMYDAYLLAVSGQPGKEASVEARADKCMGRIKHLLELPAEFSSSEEWLDCLSVQTDAKSASLLKSNGAVIHTTGNGKTVQENIAKLINWIQVFRKQLGGKVELGRFKQFIFKLNSGIILFQEAGKKFLFLETDHPTTPGLVQWNVLKLMPWMLERGN